MVDNERLPISDPGRVLARQRKLWAREIAIARNEQVRDGLPYIMLLCPCRLCSRGFRSRKFLYTVQTHLDDIRGFGRDPACYGSSHVNLMYPLPSGCNFIKHDAYCMLFSFVLCTMFGHQ